MGKKVTHFLYCPFTGLGLYGGMRGNRWLRNRIKIFQQFVLPSLLAQTNKDFILWISWRHEERRNPYVQGFKDFLDSFTEFKTVFTYSGVCFWDDKYSDEMARTRLANAIHGSLVELFDTIGICDEVIMTIQPSDDCYIPSMVDHVQTIFRETDYQAIGYKKGYVADYKTLAVKEWNPKTIPPFFSIRFPTQTFIDPFKHMDYTGPYKSHEYIGDKLKFFGLDVRGFVVGTHGENISTVFNHPYAGADARWPDFLPATPLRLKVSFRKVLLKKLPPYWQKKLRYWLGERFYARIYNILRG